MSKSPWPRNACVHTINCAGHMRLTLERFVRWHVLRPDSVSRPRRFSASASVRTVVVLSFVVESSYSPSVADMVFPSLFSSIPPL
eukprot:4552825-Pleurochrysis_carterae.AAC.1